MKNYKKHIDAFFREKAGRASETPPSHIWEHLNKQLDSLPAAQAPIRRLKYFALLSLVLLISIPAIKKITAGAAGPSAGTNAVGAPGKTASANGQQPREIKDASTSAPAFATTVPASDATEPQQRAQKSQGIAVAAKAVKNKQTAMPPASSPSQHKKAKKASYSSSYADNPIKPNTTPRIKHGRYTNAYAANTPDNKGAIQPSERIYSAAPNQNQPDDRPAPSQAYPANLSAGPNAGNDPVNAATAATTTTAPVKKPVPSNISKQPELKKEMATRRDDRKHKKPTPPDQRWEGGIKAGYEIGFNSSAASKYVISPFLQYNITSKISLVAQPAAKYAQLSAHSIGNDATYYQVNDDGVVTPVSGNNYSYTVAHDSVVKSYTYRGSYMELELPILVKYYVTKRASVFGGINAVYSMPPGITELTYTKNNIRETINFTSATPDPVAPDMTYTGTPLTTYNGPLYKSSTAGQFHIGYMAGFSYEVGRKWLFDALVEQCPAASGVVGGYNVNAPLSQMYFRISAGYKFKKSAKKNNPFGHQDTGRGD